MHKRNGDAIGQATHAGARAVLTSARMLNCTASPPGGAERPNTSVNQALWGRGSAWSSAWRAATSAMRAATRRGARPGARQQEGTGVPLKPAPGEVWGRRGRCHQDGYRGCEAVGFGWRAGPVDRVARGVPRHCVHQLLPVTLLKRRSTFTRQRLRVGDLSGGINSVTTFVF